MLDQETSTSVRARDLKLLTLSICVGDRREKRHAMFERVRSSPDSRDRCARHDETMTPGRGRGRRSPSLVLIVEDDANVAAATAEAVGAAGYRAICAHDSLQALEVLAHEVPAVLLVDLSLPGMGGSELLRRIKTSPAWCSIPRVIMTGTNDPMIGVREDAPVFYKPLDMASLVQVLQRYCDRAQPRWEAERPTPG